MTNNVPVEPGTSSTAAGGHQGQYDFGSKPVFGEITLINPSDIAPDFELAARLAHTQNAFKGDVILDSWTPDVTPPVPTLHKPLPGHDPVRVTAPADSTHPIALPAS